MHWFYLLSLLWVSHCHTEQKKYSCWDTQSILEKGNIERVDLREVEEKLTSRRTVALKAAIICSR